MIQSFKLGQGSIVLRVKLKDSSVTTDAGLTGLTSASGGLIISTIADTEASATVYTSAGSTIESITTLGTYAAPTASKCRFKEVDATNHKGLYELQFADARFAVANARSLTISISGAANLAEADFVVQLQRDDPYTAKPTNFASTVISAGGVVDSNVVSVSSDVTAATNLRDTFNGTGYSNDEAPAKQSQLTGLSNVGSAVSRPAVSYVLTSGSVSSGTYLVTAAFDNIYHIHADAAGSLDLYYEFNVGAGTPSSVNIVGYLTGNHDDLEVHGYDWSQELWVRIGTINGTTSSTPQSLKFTLFVDMVGRGANMGKVRVRFTDGAFALTSATLAIDFMYVEFNQTQGGYDDGTIYVDTSGSNVNTVVGVDGIATNPVSTISAALTLSASTNLKRIRFNAGASIVLPSAVDDFELFGNMWHLDLNSKSISGSVICGASVEGICTGIDEPQFDRCIFDHPVTIPPCKIRNSYLGGGVLTLASAGDYYINNCVSRAPGSGTPTLNMNNLVGPTNLSVRNYAGGLSVSNISAGDIIVIGGPELGDITLSGSDGSVEIRGVGKPIGDNRTGTPSLILTGYVNTGYTVSDMDTNSTKLASLSDGFVRATKGIVIGTTGIGSTVTNIITSSLTPAGSVVDQFKGRYLVFADDTVTAALRGQATDILASTASATPAFTVTALTTEPVSGDIFSIT